METNHKVKSLIFLDVLRPNTKVLIVSICVFLAVFLLYPFSWLQFKERESVEEFREIEREIAYYKMKGERAFIQYENTFLSKHLPRMIASDRIIWDKKSKQLILEFEEAQNITLNNLLKESTGLGRRILIYSFKSVKYKERSSGT